MRVTIVLLDLDFEVLGVEGISLDDVVLEIWVDVEKRRNEVG